MKTFRLTKMSALGLILSLATLYSLESRELNFNTDQPSLPPNSSHDPILRLPEIKAIISRDSVENILIDLESVDQSCDLLNQVKQQYFKNLSYVLSDSSQIIVTDFGSLSETGRYRNENSELVYQCRFSHPNPLGQDADRFQDSSVNLFYYSGCTDDSCLETVTGPVTVFGAVITGNAFDPGNRQGGGCHFRPKNLDWFSRFLHEALEPEEKVED